MLSYVFNVFNVNNYCDCSRCRELLRGGFRRPSAALRPWSMWTSYLSPALGASQRVGVKPWGWVLDLRISKQELWLSGCLASLLLSLLSNKSAVYFRGWKEKLRNPGLQWIIRCSYPTPCSAVVFCETWLPTWHLLGIPQNFPESSEEKNKNRGHPERTEHAPLLPPACRCASACPWKAPLPSIPWVTLGGSVAPLWPALPHPRSAGSVALPRVYGCFGC